MEKKKKTLLMVIIAIIIIAVLLVGGFLVYPRMSEKYYEKQSEVFADEMKKIDDAMAKNKEPDMEIKSKGKMGELEKFYKESIKDITQKMNRVFDLFAEIDPKNIAQNVQEIKAKTATLKTAIEELNQALTKFFNTENLIKETQKLKLPKAVEDELIKDINEKYLSIEEDIADQKEVLQSAVTLIEEAIKLYEK